MKRAKQTDGFYQSCDAPPHWISGKIRRKLTLFVVLILAMVVGLFWFCSVYLLKPVYERSIRRDLALMLTSITAVVNDADAQGIPILDIEILPNTPVSATRLSNELLEYLDNAIESGYINISGRCLEISGPGGMCLLLADGLRPRCDLHPAKNSRYAIGSNIEYEENSAWVVHLRQTLREQGYLNIEEEGQFVMGAMAAGGTVSIIVADNLERIPKAVNVLKRLLLPLSIILGALSVFAAWAFSRWFTKPVNQLSVAAKEMAKGNYNVRVECVGEDEIAELSRDFNHMAEEVKRSADLQRDLIANVSHDLRTPLTLIKGYAETVRDLTGDDEQRRTDQLNVIVDETDRLSTLVDSVMELSRVSSGHEKPEMVVFDLSELCDEMSYRYQAISQQMGYQFVFSGEENSKIFADPALIERALDNLLGNALKHVGADGYVGLRIFKTNHGTVRCEVTDHGPGIATEDLDHIFDRYYRARSDSGKPGTGLGLSITKAIFVAHGFEFGVITEQGRGSVFWFEGKLAK